MVKPLRGIAQSVDAVADPVPFGAFWRACSDPDCPCWSDQTEHGHLVQYPVTTYDRGRP